ncbi:caspase family protein [Clostridium estertheticum]|uniref:caspase family protein n=1 Tax=Clostridium estertheticum TaxID=238834 RepID=UPI001C0B4331|nr:caspase family protein [Clostridium estertheticum]MBU3075686.1 caspase family protein [Clostridium estertheticum]MBU3165798.1 caspase family protein [Clostridium estertheticum]
MNKKQKEKIKESIGKSVLVSIGINNYDSKDFPNLSRACNDAMAVFESFRSISNLNFNASKSKILLSNDSHNEANKANILNTLKHVCNETDYNEKLIFYFSGHGHKLGDINYIVPSDSINSLHDELIEIQEIINIVESSKSYLKLIILDSCFSGLISIGSKGFSEYNVINIKEYIKKSCSISIITSSGRDESSSEISMNESYSVFTTYLIEALEGKPEALQYVYLTVSSLYKYIFEKVRQVCRSNIQINQRPTFSTISNGDAVLGMYDIIVINEDNDMDNTSEINVIQEEDLFIEIERKLKIRISDPLWYDTKSAISELILNCFEHEKSENVRIEFGYNKMILKSEGAKFDSLKASKQAIKGGLEFFRKFMDKYNNKVIVNYNYEYNENKITLEFVTGLAFKIENLCVIEVNSIGFRKYTSKDIIMPIGKCKKYYYYISKYNMCISMMRSAVDAIIQVIPPESKLIVVDRNGISGTISAMDYIAHPRLIYRTK